MCRYIALRFFFLATSLQEQEHGRSSSNKQRCVDEGISITGGNSYQNQIWFANIGVYFVYCILWSPVIPALPGRTQKQCCMAEGRNSGAWQRAEAAVFVQKLRRCLERGWEVSTLTGKRWEYHIIAAVLLTKDEVAALLGIGIALLLCK